MEITNRPNAQAIKNLKERIKSLSAKQRPLKLLRKTLLPQDRRVALLAETGMTEAWKGLDPEDLSHRAWGWVAVRRLEITAALNLYHELRGSEHRHGVEEVDRYHYDKALGEIRKELAV